MFTDKHVRELHPADFKQLPRNRVGKGSYGTVYRAEWRGLTVAVKVIWAAPSAKALLPVTATVELTVTAASAPKV